MLPRSKNYSIYPAVVRANQIAEFIIALTERSFLFYERRGDTPYTQCCAYRARERQMQGPTSRGSSLTPQEQTNLNRKRVPEEALVFCIFF